LGFSGRWALVVMARSLSALAQSEPAPAPPASAEAAAEEPVPNEADSEPNPATSAADPATPAPEREEPAEPSLDRLEGPQRTPPELRYWTGEEPPAPPNQQPPQPPTPSAPRFKAINIRVELAGGSLGGRDFEGNKILVATSGIAEAIAVPAFDAGLGLTLGAGFGLMPIEPRQWGFWIDFEYSVVWLNPHSPFVESDLERADFRQFDIAFRLQYRPIRQLAPYVRIAAGPASFDVKGVHFTADPSTQTVIGDSSETDFSGGGFGIGVGATVSTHDYVMLDAYFGYRTMSVDHARGLELESNLDGSGWVARIGPALCF
jgi:hypothetical protein